VRREYVVPLYRSRNHFSVGNYGAVQRPRAKRAGQITSAQLQAPSGSVFPVSGFRPSALQFL
jgi:hypothetical protein